jgi:cytidine deaminase
MPCGLCREFMREFSKDLDIVLTKPGEDTEIRVVTWQQLIQY